MNIRLGVILVLIIGVLGCSDIVEIEDISKDNVVLIAPFDNAVLESTTLNFSWEPVANADDYQFQIATPNFEQPLQIVVDSMVTINKLLIEDLKNGVFEWRVKALNSGYETSYSKHAFTIE